MQIDKSVSDLVAMNIIKVSAHSRTAAVAGAIAGVMRDTNHAEVQAIGAGAVNQAVKAIVIAKGYLAEEGVHIMCVPSFVEIDIDNQERTAIRFDIQPVI
jgi:stage V sporulation protein S